MIKELWNNRSLKVATIAVIAAFGAGFLASSRVSPTIETVSVEDTVSKQKLQQAIKVEQELRQQLASAEKTITDLKSNTTEKVRIVYRKDGTTIVDKTTTTNVDTKTETIKNTTEDTTKNTTVTDSKTVETKTDSHKETKTVEMPKDKFYVGASGSVGLLGLSNPGVEFKYRLLDLGKISLWTGAEAFVSLPPTQLSPQFRVSVGISF